MTMTSEAERVLDRLVYREVGHCVSELVFHFSSNPNSLAGSEYSQDDLADILVQDDYENAVRESPFFVRVDEDGTVVTQSQDLGDDGEKEEEEECAGWEEAADAWDIEPLQNEAYEHWIVSGFLADKLREQGEMVGELFDLTIWGRTTTGQAISMDGVIQRIAAEMEILPGQRHSWE